VTDKVEVSSVKSLGDFLTFCRVPRLLYSGQKGFACSLDAERWTLHAHWLNPHYRRVHSQAFLAHQSGKVVGRIEAQMFKSIVPVAASPAQFGCLDAIDDPNVVAALVRAAENWLSRHGADLIQGPFSPSCNSEVGLLVEGFQAEPMIFMPWHPSYLGRMLDDLGYTKIHDLISYRYDVDESDRSTSATIANRPEWRKRLKFRSFRIGETSSDARIVVDIFNDGWRGNWGFVPLDLDKYEAMGCLLRHFVTQDHSFIIELDEEPVGFVIVAPNTHDLTADLGGRLFPSGAFRLIRRIMDCKFRSGRLDFFGLRQKLHRTATGGAVTLAMIEEVRARSRKVLFEFIELGWVLDDNFGMRRAIEITSARIDKIHRIYEKRLGGVTPNTEQAAQTLVT